MNWTVIHIPTVCEALNSVRRRSKLLMFYNTKICFR